MNIKNLILPVFFLYSVNQQTVHAEESFKGVFLGVEGGYIFGHSHLNRKIDKTAFPNLKDDKFNLSSHGILGGVFIEYNQILNHKFLLGFQINTKWSQLSGKVNNFNFVPPQSIISDLKMKQTYGVILRGGYLIEKILPYVMVGLLTSKWHSKTQGMPALGQGSTSKNLTGYELGAGIDYSLNKSFVVGLKFAHTKYNEFSYLNRLSSGQILHKVKVRPQTNALTCNVKYKF